MASRRQKTPWLLVLALVGALCLLWQQRDSPLLLLLSSRTTVPGRLDAAPPLFSTLAEEEDAVSVDSAVAAHASSNASASQKGKGANGEAAKKARAKKAGSSSDTVTAARAERVAVLTSGTSARYFLNSSVQGLLAPLVKQGHMVDYYLALNMERFASYRADANSYVPDSIFRGGADEAAKLIGTAVNAAGATLRHLDLAKRVKLPRADSKNIDKFKWRQNKNTTVSVFKFVMKLEDLWLEVEKVEKAWGHYTYVIIVKDDAFWIEPFDLNRVLQTGRADKRAKKRLSMAYVLRCTQLISTYNPEEHNGVTEYMVVLERAAAEPFGRMYSKLCSTKAYWELFNLEALYCRLAQDNAVQLRRLPARMMPLQRAGRVAAADGQLQVCLHKRCDSTFDGVPLLEPTKRLPSCPGSKVIHKKNWAYKRICPAVLPL